MKTNNKQKVDIEQIINNKQSSTSKRWFKRLIIVLILLAIVTAVAFNKKGSASSDMQFKTEKINKGDLTILVTATGSLEPTNEVEVGSEISGRIESVEVDFNDKVTIGQVLARIDTTKLKAQVTQSKASLEAAKATVLQAQATLQEAESKLKQYEKVRKLSENKVPSQTEFDSAKAAYARANADVASAKATVAQAEATLQANETDFSKAVIKSPINGVVLTREIETGQTVAASFETPVLFTLAEDLTQMELHVDVDEADIGQVKDGQLATFTVDAYPDRTFNAAIKQIRYGGETVDGVVTYETVLKVDNSEQLLRPGMTATADIIVLQIEKTLLISNAALRFEMPENTGKSNGGGIMDSLLPHPPRRETEQKQSAIKRNSQHKIWLLKDNHPEPVTITVGETNGVLTQIVEGAVKENSELIVDTFSGVK